MISGSCKILVFVALEILLSYKIVLMGINRSEGIAKFLCNVGKSAIITVVAIMLKTKPGSSNGFAPRRSLRRTRTPSLPKPSTCGTNTAALPSTPFKTTSLTIAADFCRGRRQTLVSGVSRDSGRKTHQSDLIVKDERKLKKQNVGEQKDGAPRALDVVGLDEVRRQSKLIILISFFL